jgi:uncharacterized protein (DUF1778 family)
MPASAAKPKTERLEARISAKQKEIFKQAAEMQAQSLTEFVVASALEAAKKIIHQHEVVELTLRDQKAFVQALLQPPKPNQKLRKAARRYRAVAGG